MNLYNPYAPSRNLIKVYIISIIVLVYPFVNLIDTYFNIKFLGEAFFNFSIFFGLLLMVVPRLIKYRYNIGEFCNHLFMFAITVASILIFLFNNRGSLVITFSSLISVNRFIFMPYLIFVLLTVLINNEAMLKIVVKTVVLSGVVMATFRIINFYFFPNFQLASGHIINNGQLTRNLLQGSSYVANLIVVCMFMLTLAWKKRLIVIPAPLFISIIIIMLLATLTTGSRYPQFIALLVFLYGVKQLPLLHKILYFFVAATLCMLIHLASFHAPHIIIRSLASSGDRSEKLILSLSIIFTSLKSFLFGTSNNLIGVQRTASGLPVSDNSFMLIAMSYGVPLALTWFFYMGSFFKKHIKSGFLLFYSLYILVGLGLTNCILWDGWVFMIILGVICMAHMYNYKTGRGVYEKIS